MNRKSGPSWSRAAAATKSFWVEHGAGRRQLGHDQAGDGPYRPRGASSPHGSEDREGGGGPQARRRRRRPRGSAASASSRSSKRSGMGSTVSSAGATWEGSSKPY